MNMFSEEARRRRTKARDRRDFGPVAPLQDRLSAAGVAAGVSVFIPIGTTVAAEAVRRWIGARDPEVLMWWPVSESHVALPISCGFLAALVFGVAALAGGWPVLRRAIWVWVGLGLAAGASAALSLDSSVRVYRDSVVVDAGAATKSLKPGIYRFANADLIETRCNWISRKRDSDYVTVDYRVRFSDGTWIDLSEARPQGPGPARAWFGTLSRLDAAALGGVPHTPFESDGVACIRVLRSELGEVDFAVARRMMVIGDEDFARRYSEPHEAWSRPAKAP